MRGQSGSLAVSKDENGDSEYQLRKNVLIIWPDVECAQRDADSRIARGAPVRHKVAYPTKMMTSIPDQRSSESVASRSVVSPTHSIGDPADLGQRQSP